MTAATKPGPCVFPRCVKGEQPSYCGHDCDVREKPYEHEYGTPADGLAAWGQLRLMVAIVVGVTTLAALVTFAVGEAMALGNEQHHVAAYTLGVGAITFGIAVLSALFAWGTK